MLTSPLPLSYLVVGTWRQQGGCGALRQLLRAESEDQPRGGGGGERGGRGGGSAGISRALFEFVFSARASYTTY
eukprot:1194951-Prorocentrum_minimum.AAC.8